jgi:hypothetical protein
MNTFALLSEAFSKYELEIPPDICSHVNHFMRKEPYICCNYCNLNLLEVSFIKPFIKHVPTYYKVNYGKVFTSDGMLTNYYTKNVDIETVSSESVLTVKRTPDVLNMCGVIVKNEIIRYEKRNWYKCLYSESENDFIYLCVNCFIFKRKIRRIFYKWKNLSFEA